MNVSSSDNRMDAVTWLDIAQNINTRQRALEKQCAHYGARFITQEEGIYISPANCLLKPEQLKRIRADISILRNDVFSQNSTLQMNLKDIHKRICESLLWIETHALGLEDFIVLFTQKINSWEEKTEQLPKKQDSKGTHLDIAGCLSKEKEENISKVQSIDNLIARDGGKTGSWSNKEHDAFLMAITKSKNINTQNVDLAIFACRENAGPILRHRSDHEIFEHVEWYHQYTQRCERKRNIVREWRLNREEKRKLITTKPKIETKEVGLIKEPSQNKKERLQKQAEIQTWRLRKQMEDQRASKEKVMMEKEILKRELIKRQNRSAKTKQKLEDYYLKKAFDEEASESEKATKFTKDPVFSFEEMERRRQRELETVKQRYLMIQQRKADHNISKKQQRLRKKVAPVAEVLAQRDFNRLHLQTKSSNAKAYTAFELDKIAKDAKRSGAHQRPVALAGRDLKCNIGIRRAVPTWRKGIH